MSETTRSFIAVELDKQVQQEFSNIQNKLIELDLQVRWVKPSNIHLTLKFLGDVKNKRLKTLISAFPKIFEGIKPFIATIESLGAFPNADNPRIIWAGINDNARQVIDLANSIEESLGQLGFRKERQRFIPHMTLGRIKGKKNLGKLSQALDGARITPVLSQEVKNITLFKSTLTPSGSIYEALATSFLA